MSLSLQIIDAIVLLCSLGRKGDSDTDTESDNKTIGQSLAEMAMGILLDGCSDRMLGIGVFDEEHCMWFYRWWVVWIIDAKRQNG